MREFTKYYFIGKTNRRIFIHSLIGLLLLIPCKAGASECRTGCLQSDTNALQYKPGNVYEYAFDSIMTVGSSSVVNADTSLKVVGNAKLFAEGNCGYALQLSNVKVISTKENLEKKITQNIQRPVHFNIEAGQIDPQICVDSGESTYALNIKRAIISLFQTTIERKTEVDVYGQCNTYSSVSKIGNADVITKIRNLNKCGYREHITSGMMSGIVNQHAGVKSSELLQADYSKEIKVQNGLVDSCHVVEEYSFFPNAGKSASTESKIRAKVITNLKLKNSNGVAATAPALPANKVPVTIIFQKPEAYTNKNIGALKTALTDVIQKVENYVKKDTAKSFVELIRLMRNSDFETLMELATVPHPNKVLTRKVYLDALFRTSTSDSARAIIKQIGKMEDKEKLIAFLSLMQVQVVDRDTIQQVANLLNINSPKEVYLAVGTLVSKYCQNLGKECSDTAITGISKKFIDGLRHCKANTKKDEERILYVLKGIGNAKQISAAIGNTALKECMSIGKSTRIRITAFQAYAEAASCEPILKQTALDILRDKNEDAEIRIEAYLSLVKCPTADLGNDIAEIINNETVYQIGGFIDSHLRAIRDSTDSSRELLRNYLGNVRITKKFPKDYRRYSFNNEISYKLESLGIGASADYKLIYSQNGFLPRSARLNLTSEIYGHNYNILDVSLRQENIEQILEYYIGPKGLLNKDFDEIMKAIGVGEKNFGDRSRRSISDDTSKFAKRYKTYGSKHAQDINLDLSLKFFGSELMFLSLGDNIPRNLDDLIIFFSTTLEQLKHEVSVFSKEFHVHNFFMDSKLSYPTGVGIPLELTAQGFAANKLEVAVNVDFDAILQQNWQEAQYRFKLIPSVDVQIQMQLGFNAYVLESGICVTSSGHTAAGSDVTISFLNDGNSFNLAVELPREKLEIINFQLNADLYIAEQDKNIRTLTHKSQTKHENSDDDLTEMCFNQLDMFGFNICFQSSDLFNNKKLIDNRSLLPNSPYNFVFYITSERKLDFKFYHIPSTSTGSQMWKLDYSTPGSQQPHDTSFGVELGVQHKSFIRLSADSNQNKFAVEAGLNNDQRELVVYSQYEQNSIIKRNKIGFTKNGNEYRPIIEVQDKNGAVLNDLNGIQVDGRVIVQETSDQLSRYNFENFKIINKNNEQLELNGWMDISSSTLNGELLVQPGSHSYLVKPTIKIANNEYNIGLFINNQRTPQMLYGASAYLKLNEGLINVRLMGKARQWEFNAINDLQYVQKDGVHISSSKFKNVVTITKDHQLMGLFKLSGSTVDKIKLELETELQQGKTVAALMVKYNSGQRSEYNYNLEVQARYNKHSIDLLSKCNVITNNRLSIDNKLSTSWGTVITAKGEVGQRFAVQDVYIDLQGIVQFNEKDKPLQWISKAIGTTEKTNIEFKLKKANVDAVTFVLETQHPQDKLTTGKLNFNVKTGLNVQSEFKIAKNGKGELSVTIETLDNDQKHKVNVQSQFYIQAPKYDIDATILINTMPDKRVHFKTETELNKHKFVTKNIFEIGDKKLLFDANANYKGELWNGEVTGDFILNCPQGHTIDGKFIRKISTNAKNGLTQGNIDINLSDKYNSKTRSVSINGNLEKYNIKQRTGSIESNIVLTTFDEKQLLIQHKINHLNKGHNKMLDFNLRLNGNLLAVPEIQVEVIVDEYNAKQANYQIKGKYGDSILTNVKGKYNIGEREQIPSTFELTVNLEAPQTDFMTFELSTNGKYTKQTTEAGGAYQIDIHIDERFGNKQFLRLNTLYKGSQQQGSYSVQLETKHMKGPLRLQGSYQREQITNLKENNVQIKIINKQDYDYDGQYIYVNSIFGYDNAGAFNFHYTFDSNREIASTFDIQVNGKNLEEDGYELNAQAKIKEKTYDINSKIFRSLHKKGIDIHANLANDKPLTVLGIVELSETRKAKIIVELNNVFDMDLTADVKSQYVDIHDFYILAQWSSNKFNLKNYDLAVYGKGQTVSLNLKNANGIIYAGSANYSLKKENNKAVVEGQGQMQYNDKTQQINFKLIRQVFELQSDNEIGFAYTFYGNFGAKNGISTFKITNKEFNVKLSTCEEKRQCTNVQVQSTITNDPTNFDWTSHSLLILIDLRNLGYPYEFELVSKTLKDGFKYQYSLDSNINSVNNIKYQLILAVQPVNAKIQIKLPQREILLETTQKTPRQGELFGHYEQSVVFYFDKTNKPKDVTRLIASADITGVERRAFNFNGNLRLEHPTLRPLSATAKLDVNRDEQKVSSEVILDIFRLEEQQIIASSYLKNSAPSENGFNITLNEMILSKGLGIEYKCNSFAAFNKNNLEFNAGGIVSNSGDKLKGIVYIFGNKDQIEISIRGLNEQLLHIQGQFDRQHYRNSFDTKLQWFAQKPIEISSKIEPTNAKITIRRAELIEATGEVKLAKEIKFNLIGAGKEIANSRVALNAENFLQTTINADKNDVEAYLETVENIIREENKSTREFLHQRFKQIRADIDNQLQLVKDSTPDFTAFKNSYKQNTLQLIKELETDTNLKGLAEQYQKIYVNLTKFVSDLVKTTVESFEKLHASGVRLYEKIEIAVRDTVIPLWEEFLVIATNIVSEFRIEVINLYTKSVETIIETLKEYEPIFKTHGKAILEVLKPVLYSIQELTKVFTDIIEDSFTNIKENIAKIPTFEELYTEWQEQLEKLKVVERVLEFVNNVFEELHILPQTPESTEFLNEMQKYIVSKFNKQPINDKLVLQDLIKRFIKAIRSLWLTFGISENSTQAQGIISLHGISELISGIRAIDIFKVPALLSLRFSLLNKLLNEHWDELFEKVQPQYWSPFDDFKLHGHVSDGHQFITFDGYHISFPGTCKYILSQDSVDNNFTIVAQLNQGKLKSIALIERDGDYVEILDSGVLKLNGQVAEYPQHNTGGLHVWRRFYTAWLYSDYGVQVICTIDLKTCNIIVDGFYTSKTRGLLGNGNSEPFDDFVQIDGSIASDYAAFGNGYGIGKCQTITYKAPDTNSPHADICNDIFGIESPLMLGYLTINSKPFRQACDAAVNSVAEKDKEATACTIATSYGSALRLRHVHLPLPTRCLKCNGPNGQREIGQEFTQKLPGNKADIVFVVDLGVNSNVLNNLIAPIIKNVRDSLKERGITDVQEIVIAYNETLQYPSLLTSDGSKLNYQGNLPEVHLGGPKSITAEIFDDVVVDNKLEDFYDIINNIIQSILPQSNELAFKYALDYPFRAAAAKSIIAIRSKPIKPNIIKLMRTQFATMESSSQAATMHLIYPVEELSLENVPTERIVGFNARLVATIDGKDAKKRKKLQFKNNLATDIVINNGGWVFATEHFNQLKSPEQKKTLQQIVNTIADTIYKTEIVANCECRPDHGLHAKHVCSIKSSNFIPNKQFKATV